MYAPSVGSGNTTGSDFLDIDPKLGRVVVFKRLNFLSILTSNFLTKKIVVCSDSIEHEVLPCFSRRIAITVWASSPDASERVVISKPIAVSNYRGRIFVSIANYRDSEAPLTVRDLFAKATHPHKIFIGNKIFFRNSYASATKTTIIKTIPRNSGTVFQGQDLTDEHCVISSGDCPLGQLRSVQMHHNEAKGPCYARHIAERCPTIVFCYYFLGIYSQTYSLNKVSGKEKSFSCK